MCEREEGERERERGRESVYLNVLPPRSIHEGTVNGERWKDSLADLQQSVDLGRLGSHGW